MTKEDKIFNKQLELDVLVNGLSEITEDYLKQYVTKYAPQFKDGVTELVIPEGVTRIGFRAFWNWQSIKRLTIPNSLTNIGQAAFMYCTALEHVTIHRALGDRVLNIEKGAFWRCVSLKNIDIPNSETHIAKDAFCENTKVKYIA